MDVSEEEDFVTVNDRTKSLVIHTNVQSAFKQDQVSDDENVGPSFILETLVSHSKVNQFD